MVSVWLLAKSRKYLLENFEHKNTNVQIRLDVKNIDNIGRAWLLECDSISDFIASLEDDDTIVYSCCPKQGNSIEKYTIRIIQPHKPNYGQKTADAFAMLIDENGRCTATNTLYFFDIQNPDDTCVSYFGTTIDKHIFLN